MTKTDLLAALFGLTLTTVVVVVSLLAMVWPLTTGVVITLTATVAGGFLNA